MGADVTNDGTKYFSVYKNGTKLPTHLVSKAVLVEDSWDDWFEFSTLYLLHVWDEKGEHTQIGGVKIGQFDMAKGQRRADLPSSFDTLDERFFSLGQDDSYYELLQVLGDLSRDKILSALRDVAQDLDLFSRALPERVMGTSLLRSVANSTVRGQFHRMTRGGARLTSFKFSYTAPERDELVLPLALTFEVEPDTSPPTNIHVLVGRNGVGKTTLLNDLTGAVVSDGSDPSLGTLIFEEDFFSEVVFSNLVSVTFSAFDPFVPIPDRHNRSEGTRYTYVGLKRTRRGGSDVKQGAPKSPDDLARDFGASALICQTGAKANRWRLALENLEADPIFKDAAVAGLAEFVGEDLAFKAEARALFRRLSSGHKIVLLAITRLVETVEEKTLVLIDEPEAHLHPPLLSAFIRALSDLLIDRNGVGIIATHSPVVLQEVPKTCVWKIYRSGLYSNAERPEIETFGENVGILTREVFGLEVGKTGFHRVIENLVSAGMNYEEIIAQFSGQVGGEARAVARALLAAQSSGVSDQ